MSTLGNQLNSASNVLTGQGLTGLQSTAAPRKIAINRILIKAEVRKCFAGTDWESQDLATILNRICDKLGVYGDVNEGVRASVEDQIRGKLKEKGINADSHGKSVPPPQPSDFGGDAFDNKEEEEVAAAMEPVDLYKFSEPPAPRVISAQDAAKVNTAMHMEEEDSSDDADLWAGQPSSPVAQVSSVGYDWTLEKLKRTVEMQFVGATSWRTVINAVQASDSDYTSKIATELYQRIQSSTKPFSHEEVGNMALTTLDKLYIEIESNKKRDPTTSLQPQPAASSEGGINLVGVAAADNALVTKLQQENTTLKSEVERLRAQNRDLSAEVNKLKSSLIAMETNQQQMAAMLKNKNSEAKSNKQLVSELSQQNTDFTDESLAVKAQMEEIRQFAIRSQQAARAQSQSVAAQQSVVAQAQKQQQAQAMGQINPVQAPRAAAAVQVGEANSHIVAQQKAQMQQIQADRLVAAQMQAEGQPRRVAASGVVAAAPAQAVNAVVVKEKVDSTIPQELHSIHFPDPNLVGPWQSTTSYTKTKRGTTKAIVTWTLVDSRENRHVVTLEHNHYAFRGKSKRKVIIDNHVRLAEKSGNLNYKFNLALNDTVTVIISSSQNGFEYELMVNDLTFGQAKRYYVDIQNALRQSVSN